MTKWTVFLNSCINSDILSLPTGHLRWYFLWYAPNYQIQNQLMQVKLCNLLLRHFTFGMGELPFYSFPAFPLHHELSQLCELFPNLLLHWCKTKKAFHTQSCIIENYSNHFESLGNKKHSNLNFNLFCDMSTLCEYDKIETFQYFSTRKPAKCQFSSKQKAFKSCNLQYVAVVSRSMVSTFNFEFFLPILLVFLYLMRCYLEAG